MKFPMGCVLDTVFDRLSRMFLSPSLDDRYIRVLLIRFNTIYHI